MPQRGLSLIEILVVVAIVAMLAGMGGIQVARARMSARETIGLTTLQTLYKASHFYFVSNNQFPSGLTILGPQFSSPPFLSEELAQVIPVKHGYQFVYTPTPDLVRFTLKANPTQYAVTGTRHFFTDETGAIHFTDENREATIEDPLIP